jgi:hypothetical protein
MKTNILLIITLVSIVNSRVVAQASTVANDETSYPYRILTIEPGVGIHTNFGTDILITNLVQWNPRKHLSLASHSSFNINNVTQRNFNFIKTNYNYSLNQKFGAGATIYRKKSAHSFLMMVGLKYTAFQESLENPDLEKVTTTIAAVSPDYGLMYSMKRGKKKYFFICRMYVPLSPWPTKGSDVNYLDGNLNNVALEFALGIKLK